MTTPPDFKRRTLVKALAASALIPLLGSNLIACSNNSNNSSILDGLGGVPADFNHGVASGDPLTDRVILWTRVTPTGAEGNVQIQWQIADNAEFTNILGQGEGTTSADVDYTVKVDAEGLEPGSVYYYRFITGDKTSTVGKTRTLPQGSVASATFAVVSCSNYPAVISMSTARLRNRMLTPYYTWATTSMNTHPRAMPALAPRNSAG
jgi:alkaline phosphatase D